MFLVCCVSLATYHNCTCHVVAMRGGSLLLAVHIQQLPSPAFAKLWRPAQRHTSQHSLRWQVLHAIQVGVWVCAASVDTGDADCDDASVPEPTQGLLSCNLLLYCNSLRPCMLGRNASAPAVCVVVDVSHAYTASLTALYTETLRLGMWVVK